MQFFIQILKNVVLLLLVVFVRQKILIFILSSIGFYLYLILCYTLFLKRIETVSVLLIIHGQMSANLLRTSESQNFFSVSSDGKLCELHFKVTLAYVAIDILASLDKALRSYEFCHVDEFKLDLFTESFGNIYS